jgi:hypothetical protein
VTDQERHQQVLQDVVHHIEAGQRPPHARRGTGDDDTRESVHDSHSTAHKMEFPKFDGANDPLPWLNRCERFFHVRQTPGDKVAFAAFYLLGDAHLWFHRMELNGGCPT